MKQLIFVLLISCLACANNQAGQAERKKDMESTKEIYLAGGCFWGTEHFLKLIDGVETTQVGYANGNIANPTYKQVCTGTTDFAETVKVQYDPLKVDLPFLIDLYFKTIDPTSVNRQGNDKGTQYRTGIYYTDPADLTDYSRNCAPSGNSLPPSAGSRNKAFEEFLSGGRLSPGLSG